MNRMLREKVAEASKQSEEAKGEVVLMIDGQEIRATIHLGTENAAFLKRLYHWHKDSVNSKVVLGQPM